jgi:hypothetical protein
LIRAFATPHNVGKFIDLNSVVVVSAEGVTNVSAVLEESQWLDEPIPPTAVLLDADGPAVEVKKKITGADGARALILARFVATVAELCPPFGKNASIVTIEDIVPIPLYAEAIRAYVRRWLPSTYKDKASGIDELLKKEDFGSRGLVAATQGVFQAVLPAFGKDYDKLGVLQEVVAEVNRKREAKTPDENLKQLERNVALICDFLRDRLEESRAATTTKSATQAVSGSSAIFSGSTSNPSQSLIYSDCLNAFNARSRLSVMTPIAWQKLSINTLQSCRDFALLVRSVLWLTNGPSGRRVLKA